VSSTSEKVPDAFNVVYSVIKSGEFSDPAVWDRGIVPFGECIVYIGRNYIVSLESASLSVNASTIIVDGTLSIESAVGITFTFNYTVNMMISSTGTLKVGGKVNRINCVFGSLFTFLPHSSFTGFNTTLYVNALNSDNATSMKGALFTSSMQRPATYYITEDGVTMIFPRVTLIAHRSGLFSSANTWPGSFEPSSRFCEFANGCGLYILPGITLIIESPSGVFSLNLTVITVMSGAVLEIRSPYAAIGFRFTFPLLLDCFGIFKYTSRANSSVLVRPSSAINFFIGGSFLGKGATVLVSYDRYGQGNILDSFTWQESFVGPIFYQVSETGAISSSDSSKLCEMNCII
jgi:hypothetical protein